MTIHLKPELEAVIQKDVERAVQLLHEQEALLAHDSQAIHEKIEWAFGRC